MKPKRKVLILFSAPFLLFSNPEDPTVVSGNAEFSNPNPYSIVIQSGDRTIINWNAFSNRSGESIHFSQASNDSAVLNRVMGNEMSQLMGTLQGNGHIYLINPNGIIVGKEGVINVDHFFASTFDIPNETFLAGGDILFEGNSLAPIINEGSIVAQNGQVLLFAHKVENQGSIDARDGDVQLGAGHRLLLGIKGKELLLIQPEIEGDGVSNTGKIDALRTVLASSSNVLALGVQNKGMIHANRVEERNGEVYLVCKGGGLLENSGSIDAPQGSVVLQTEGARGENLGSIHAEGGSVAIQADSLDSDLVNQKPFHNYGSIDVSGAHAGKVSIVSPKFENCGSISANGKDGKIEILAPGVYIESADGKISAHGEGGEVQIIAGYYFTSGTVSANGEKGGTIRIEGEKVVSAAGVFDVAGEVSGGLLEIRSHSLEEPIHFNKFTKINASGSLQGGTVHVFSELAPKMHAKINVEGQESGEILLPQEIDPLENELSFLDPNPAGQSLLWASLTSKRGEAPFASFWKIWESGNRLPSSNQAYLQTAFTCPTNPVEYVDPNASGTSSSFGQIRVPLSSGNLVLTKPSDSFAASNAGAVYLYNGLTGALISTLRGSHANDFVGLDGITVLTNSNFVIQSSNWNGGAGAATFGSAITGVSGTVSSSNSIVGSNAGDQIGGTTTTLNNGNYVLVSPNWNGTFGAATFGNGTTGSFGVVSSLNSIVGSSASDFVGSGITVLPNSNYLVNSPNWSGGNGAATFGSGTAGISGVVASSNSLVGSTSGDNVGITVLTLTNGNYLVVTPSWFNGANSNAGAVTWGSGTSGVRGAVSSLNSLVGTGVLDSVGSGGAALLSNGNYVVGSPSWSRAGVAGTGAATWGNGSTGTAGNVSTSNSIYGTQAGDSIGLSVVSLTGNGNYVVSSNTWNFGAVSNAGSATWGNGSTGTVGQVTTLNSIVGTQSGDAMSNIVPLSNGNYLVYSSNWSNGANAAAGAVRWANGSGGTVGAVSTLNSLYGTSANDQISSNGIIALTGNGNYVVCSPNWKNGSNANAGAATWGNGSTGTVGAVSSTNSLVGTQVNDGNFMSVTALTNGNYAIQAINWAYGSAAAAGAVPWGNGASGTTGIISSLNSLVGTTANDSIGNYGLSALSNGNYMVRSRQWSYNGHSNAGAATWGNGATGTVGVVSSLNSLIGTQANDGVGNSITVLVNGNTLIRESSWHNGATTVGAVTLINSTTGLPVGPVSSSNSSTGSAAGDGIGGGDFFNAGSNAFVMIHPNWNSARGAATLCDATTGAFCDGTFGAISSSNSLVGANTSAGMQTGTQSYINSSIGAIQFTSYSGQTKVFNLEANVPSPPSPTPSPTAATTTAVIPSSLTAPAINDEAGSAAEAFSATMQSATTMMGFVPFGSQYPPSGVFSGLLWMPSFVAQENEDLIRKMH